MNMRKSKLTEHKQNKRILFTPFNNYFGDRLEQFSKEHELLSFQAKERHQADGYG